MLLIVEDDKSTSEVLGIFFNDNGIEYDLAYTTGDALDKLSLSPSIVLLDLLLGDTDGLPIIVECQKTLSEAHIIIMSALPLYRIHSMIQPFKLLYVLRKPFDWESLERILIDIDPSMSYKFCQSHV